MEARRSPLGDILCTKAFWELPAVSLRECKQKGTFTWNTGRKAGVLGAPMRFHLSFICKGKCTNPLSEPSRGTLRGTSS